MIIPVEARATLAALHEDRTPEQYLNDIWARRRAEHPGRVKSTGNWPYVAKAIKPSNITLIRKART